MSSSSVLMRSIALCALVASAAQAQESATVPEVAASAESATLPERTDELATSETAAAVVGTVAVNPTPEPAPEQIRQSAPVNRLIEEIVVTARKRDENLKDVPISISAFSSEKLEALGVNDPSDIQLVTPGLTYNSQVAYSIIYLRGVGTDAFIPSADQNVASYVDGFYTPFGFNLASKFNNIERVEVLKGPQGTLFGRNSTGGAINIVTRKPGDQLDVSLEGKVGNFNSQSASAYLSAPIVEDLSASVALLYDHSDNYHKLRNQSFDQPDENTLAGDFKVRWHLTDVRPDFGLDLQVAGGRRQGLGSHQPLSIRRSDSIEAMFCCTQIVLDPAFRPMHLLAIEAPVPLG